MATPTRLVEAALALTIAVAASLITGPGANAATATVTCTGTSAIHYQPGLTVTPRDVSYTEIDQYSPCVSTDPALTSGSSTTEAFFPDARCVGTPAVFRDPGYVIAWNNGQTSTMDLTYTDTIVLGTEQVTGVGTIIDGQFTGAIATIVWTYPVINALQCLTSQGVTSQNGILTAQIVLAW